MSSYRQLLNKKGAKSLLALSLLTRSANIPIGAFITVLAYQSSGSWEEAAITGGIAAGASAVAMWISGKWMDVWSPKNVLLFFAPGGLVPLLFLWEPKGALLFLLALLIGVTRPPSGTTIRISWQRLVQRKDDRLRAYGLDASLVPLAGAGGALLGSGLFFLFQSAGIIAMLCFLSTLSTILLAFHRTSQEKGSRKTPFAKGSRLPPLGSGVWLTVIIVALSWGALVGLEVLVGDRFGSEALLLVTALGGIAVAFGALLSHRSHDKSGKRGLFLSSLVAAFSLVSITLAFVIEPLLAFPAIISFGLARGVISASGSTYLSISSPESRRSESLALYASGVLVGQAIYRPLSGVLLLVSPLLILLIPAFLFSLLAGMFQKQIAQKTSNGKESSL